MLQSMFLDSDPKLDEARIQIQFELLKRQNEKIAEANYIKYNTAIYLEELYRSQTFARSLYEYLNSIRNTDDKRTKNKQLKVLNYILRDTLPEDIIFDKNASVIMEIYKKGLIMLNIDFRYRDNRFNLSIPDPSTIRRGIFIADDNENVWVEKATPCVWHIHENTHHLVVNSMFPAIIKEKFNNYIAERKING